MKSLHIINEAHTKIYSYAKMIVSEFERIEKASNVKVSSKKQIEEKIVNDAVAMMRHRRTKNLIK